MSLIREFEKTGSWLFKYRSYLPIILIFISIPIMYFEGEELGSFQNPLWWGLCLVISFLGLLIRIITVGYVPKGTSGRNTNMQKAEQLNIKGIYSLLRHPLYLGNFFIWLGLLLYVGNIEFLIISILVFWLYYERIMFAEELYIQRKFGEAFERWAEKTPAFFPRFANWFPPDLPFSLKTSIKKEYHGFYAIILTFSLIHFLKQLFYNKQLMMDIEWQIILVIGTIIYVIVRILAKHTKVLDIEGR